ncbi:GntR family transcriptional regulator [Rhodovastum atsumiense]|uniref:GntR family transcriptional regulator n=1 Tax=Rhodovastum atsumiense TaxID=504468 RepID=A0A5M6IVJ7_9PROT|nr:GntR family transcriptional regulator [Rhodovastum atsumiense]KAA5611949.1 GntR family transcriptional regulator [Rhodovastum atsumiense]CAH2598715.1 GntR family transcriptional regulator [Rhodovastum atsumiense]
MDSSVEPFKARRLYLLLRERIASGELPSGTRLPGEPGLAAEHGVSRMTVRRALDLLAEEGLLRRQPGSGTFVRETGMEQAVCADLADVFSHLKEMGRRTTVRLLQFGYVAPTEAVARALGLATAERAQRSVRIRLLEGAPFSWLTTHVPERIGQTYTEADLAATPLLSLLERSGIVPARARQTIGATLAGPDVAEALEVQIGAPLLSLVRVVEDDGGHGVEHLHALYRPDRFSFTMDLLRTGTPEARRWSPIPTAQAPARPAPAASSSPQHRKPPQ